MSRRSITLQTIRALRQLRKGWLLCALALAFVSVGAEVSDNALTLLLGEHITLRIASSTDLDVLHGALHVRTLDDARRSGSSSYQSTPTP